MSELKQVLEALKVELERHPHLDRDTRELLNELDGDIRDVLRSDSATSALPVGLIERAEALEVQFATKHPTLEAILRQIVDSLGRMGI